MSLAREFEIWLDAEWPTWRKDIPKRSARYSQLRRAFMAGFKIGDDGPSAEALRGVGGKPLSAMSQEGVRAIIASSPRKFRSTT